MRAVHSGKSAPLNGMSTESVEGKTKSGGRERGRFSSRSRWKGKSAGVWTLASVVSFFPPFSLRSLLATPQCFPLFLLLPSPSRPLSSCAIVSPTMEERVTWNVNAGTESGPCVAAARRNSASTSGLCEDEGKENLDWGSREIRNGRGDECAEPCRSIDDSSSTCGWNEPKPGVRAVTSGCTLTQ